MRHFQIAALVALTVGLSLGSRFAWAQGARDPGPPAGEELPAAPTGDAPAGGYLGFSAVDTEPSGKGVEVIKIHAGGPAEVAGLKVGDVVTAVDGKPLKSIEDLAKLLGTAPVGKKLRLEVTRDGKSSIRNLTLSKRPAEIPRVREEEGAEGPAPRPAPSPTVPAPRAEPRDTAEKGSLGVRLMPITEEARRRYGLTVGKGALIEGVREGGAADKFGLPLGGAIVSFGGLRINSPDELLAALKSARSGDEVEIGYYQGERTFRKTIRLGPVLPPAPSDLPAGLDAGPGAGPRTDAPPLGDRPVVRKLEGLLDKILPPDGAAREPAVPRDDLVPRPADGRGSVAELRSEVEFLKGEIARMQRKISELEARLDRK